MRHPLAAALGRLLFAGLALAACGARAEVPAAPTRGVTDSVGFLSEGIRPELDGRLESYERQGGHQILVWIGRSTGGVPLEDFTVRAFAAWKVGRKGLDDGLVLLWASGVTSSRALMFIVRRPAELEDASLRGPYEST